MWLRDNEQPTVYVDTQVGTTSLPAARPSPKRCRGGGRESKFL